MDKKSIERILSPERLEPYLKRHKNDFDKSIQHYKSNIKITESFYPLIAIIEIGLRNNINHQLAVYFGSKNWFDSPEFIKIVSGFQIDRVSDARKKILKSKQEITSSRIVSELTFGFWTSLFDSKYERNLWKPLRLSFPACPKNVRQRKTMSTKFNGIRKFRNRLFHHEAIAWNHKALVNYRNELIEGISWLDKELVNWSNDIFNIDTVLNTEKGSIE